MSDNENYPSIKVTKDGPYIVTGDIPMSRQIVVVDEEGTPIAWEEGRSYPVTQIYALCRCGHSGKKPFCDGMHSRIGFNGEETADIEIMGDAIEITEGPELILEDIPGLCSGTGFCHLSSGVWDLVEKSDDIQSRQKAIEGACNCPSGRLTIIDKRSGEALGPGCSQSIGIIEEPEAGCSGPVWVRGDIPVESADNTVYKTGSTYTLCRCGKSDNKPFCDGEHSLSGFRDEDFFIENK